MKGQQAYLDDIIMDEFFIKFVQERGGEYRDFEPYMFDKNNDNHKKLYEMYIESGHNPEAAEEGIGVILDNPDTAYDLRINLGDNDKQFSIHNSAIAYDLLASQKKVNGKPAPECDRLRKRALSAIKEGTDKYAIQIMLMRAVNCSGFIKQSKGSLEIDNEALSQLPKEEQKERKNYITGCLKAGRIVEITSSPYDKIFEMAEEIERLERDERTKINSGLDVEHIQEEIENIKDNLAKYMGEFDPDMLARILKSKKMLESEKQKFEQGYTELDRFKGKMFVTSRTIEYSACTHVEKQIRKMMNERAMNNEMV